MNGRDLVLGAAGALVLGMVAAERRFLRERYGSSARRGRSVQLVHLPHDMHVLLRDFVEELYWHGDRESPPTLPASFPIHLVPVDPLYRQVAYDSWDDRGGPKHVNQLRRAMRKALNLRPEDAPETREAYRSPAAVARAFLQLVPNTRASAEPGVLVTRIPPIVVRSRENFWDGRHRLFAAHQLGLTHLPAIDLNDLDPDPAGSRSVQRGQTAASLQSRDYTTSGRGVVSDRFPTWETVRRRLVKDKLQQTDEFEQEMEYAAQYGEENGEPVSEREQKRVAWEEMETRWNNFESRAHRFENPLKIWREITAKDVASIRLTAKKQTNRQDTRSDLIHTRVHPQEGVGIYWSHHPDFAEAHWGGAGKGFLLAAEVDPKYVDWPGTFYANITMPEEHEIRLKTGAPVRILRIRDDDGNVVLRDVLATA